MNVARSPAACWWIAGSFVGPVGSLLVVAAIYALAKGLGVLAGRRPVRDASRSALSR